MINSIFNLIQGGKTIGTLVRYKDGSCSVNYGDGNVHVYPDQEDAMRDFDPTVVLEGISTAEVPPSSGQLDQELVQLTIGEVCDDLKKLLIGKNQAYGNSALDPLRVVSKCTSLEGIRVRIDDKLNRLQKGSEYAGDDTLQDLAGYLVLYLVGRRLGLQ